MENVPCIWFIIKPRYKNTCLWKELFWKWVNCQMEAFPSVNHDSRWFENYRHFIARSIWQCQQINYLIFKTPSTALPIKYIVFSLGTKLLWITHFIEDPTNLFMTTYLFLCMVFKIFYFFTRWIVGWFHTRKRKCYNIQVEQAKGLLYLFGLQTIRLNKLAQCCSKG